MNESLQKIKIDGIEYFIIDSIQDFRAEDSFIHRKNKLAQYRGNGEAKKHVGTYKGDLGNKIAAFFDYENWGLSHFDLVKRRKTFKSASDSGAVIQEGTCFFSKSNLLKYLNDSKAEYYNKEQVYHNDISTYFEERYNQVSSLSTDHIYFSIYDASDNLDQIQSRGYIRSDDKIWSLWRELILPKISYLSILKLVPVVSNEQTKSPLFYFRILLDYQYRAFVHPSNGKEDNDANNDSDQRNSNQNDPAPRASRKGQEKFKKEVVDLMPQCPFTQISDERLLTASHIKPYNICVKENRMDQAQHHLNGLALSPTYDRLFDRGYITFTNKGELVCGTQLTPLTWERLRINPNAKNILRIYPENREEYLEYHRKNVFLDDINEL
jgi:predicted restriction endonuclease